MTSDDVLPDLFNLALAQSRGFTRHQAEWALKSGRWIRIRRGWYAVRRRYVEMDAVGRHLVDCRAALATHDRRHVLSHLSAALSYGLPTPIDGIDRPTLTIGMTGCSTDRQDDLIVQVASLRESDSAPWGSAGLRTRPSRTVADCLRHLPMADAVAIADAAVRAGLTDATHIGEVLRWQSGWPFIGRGEAAFELVDGRRESPLESLSAVVLHLLGIAPPVPQVVILDARGAFVARVDGYWPLRATVAEIDGRTKYGRLPQLPPGPHEDAVELARRAVVAEKEREDRLRDLGLEVARWGFAQVWPDGRPAADRIHRAWRRGDPSRFSGRAVLAHTAPLAVESGFLGPAGTG